MADLVEPRSPIQDMRGLANVLTFGIRIFAIVPQMFLRRGFGSRYIGGKTAVAFVLMPFFGAFFFPRHDLRPLMWFDGAFLFMCLLARMNGVRLRNRGYQVHSMYDGFPIFLKANAGTKRELREKAIGEPLSVGMIGGLVYAFCDEPIGALLLTSAVCLLINHAMGQAWIDRQATEIRDAQLDQQFVMERYLPRFGRHDTQSLPWFLPGVPAKAGDVWPGRFVF